MLKAGAIKLKVNNLILVGFMGVGKSTLGRFLAQETGFSFVDLDAEIERAEGLSISQIFERQGESAFRKIESLALKNVLSSSQQIVSLGGGAMVSDENKKIIQEKGFSIYLSAMASTLAKRIKGEHRPLVAGLSESEKFEKIKTLLKDRVVHYEKCDLEISTDDCTSKEVVHKILVNLRQRGLV